ncbi:MAG: helix-turn-helix transcriptional regulator [Coriobacteriales bacterium]|nr:helix-turn-helix transcriptional regulator [Coriobacteriales bacterium]
MDTRLHKWAWLRPAGGGLIWALFFICMFNYPLFGFTNPSSQANNPFNMGFIITLALALIALGFCIAAPAVRKHLNKRRLLPAMAMLSLIVGIVAAATFNATGAVEYPSYIATGFVAGCGLAVFLVYWFYDFSTLKASMIALLIPLDFLLSALITIGTLMLPRPFAVAIIILTVCVVFLCIVSYRPPSIPQGQPSQPQAASKRERLRGFFAAIRRTDRFGDFVSYTVCTIILSVVYTLVGQVAISASMTYSALNLITIADMSGAAVVALIIRSITKINLSQIYKAIFIVLSTALFFLPFLGESYWIVTNNLVVFAYYLFFMRLIVLLAQEFNGFGHYGVTLFALVSGLGFAFTLAGVIAGTILAASGGFGIIRLSTVAFVCVYIMSMALVSFANKKGRGVDLENDETSWDETKLAVRDDVVRIQQRAKHSIEQPLWSLSDDALNSLCDAFAHRYQLTRREREMLPFIIKGKTSTEISETLFLATSTVKGHVYGLYQKCTVHSRQELLSLLEHDRIISTEI